MGQTVTQSPQESNESIRRVALVFDMKTGFCRSVVRGVRMHPATQSPWQFMILDPARPDYRLLRAWEPDGAITSFYSAPFEKVLKDLAIPVVNVSHQRSQTPWPTICHDDVQIGRLAGEHLVARGFMTLGVITEPGVAFSEDRRAGFVEIARAGGREVETLSVPPRKWTPRSQDRYRRLLEDWLISLPRPAGVFADNDRRGLEVLNACLQTRLRVPEDIAVLGVDNDELLCELGTPPLSSVQTAAQRIGTRAAELLDALLAGRDVSAEPIRIPPVAVIDRQSTDIQAIDDPHLATVLRAIALTVSQPVTVEEVLADVPLSRRSLERRFKQALGRSVLDEIHRVKIQRARQLLAGSTYSIGEIATQCGFHSQEWFAVTFRKKTGQSPSDYRAEMQSRSAPSPGE